MSLPTPLALQDSRYAPCKSGNPLSQEIWLLHGYASHQDDLFGFAPYLSKEFAIRSLRATHPLDFGGYAWYALSFDDQGIRQTNEEEAQASMERVAEALRWHAEAFPEAPRPILMGFSQGGILSNALRTRYPDLVRGIAAVASYFPVEWSCLGQVASNLPHWAAVGTEDGVVPAQMSLPSYETARVIHGMDVDVHTYPMPHTISPACFTDLLQWFRQVSA